MCLSNQAIRHYMTKLESQFIYIVMHATWSLSKVRHNKLPAHSFNLLVELLAEHRTWRSFARLRNRRVVPDAKMLHEFRSRLDLKSLRRLNAQLLASLLEGIDPRARTVALIDATDLPASVNAYKKTRRVPTRHTGRPWADAA